jgi:hypothetical protein
MVAQPEHPVCHRSRGPHRHVQRGGVSTTPATAPPRPVGQSARGRGRAQRARRAGHSAPPRAVRGCLCPPPPHPPRQTGGVFHVRGIPSNIQPALWGLLPSSAARQQACLLRLLTRCGSWARHASHPTSVIQPCSQHLVYSVCNPWWAPAFASLNWITRVPAHSLAPCSPEVARHASLHGHAWIMGGEPAAGLRPAARPVWQRCWAPGLSAGAS